jgi:hypothetical protein
MANVPKVGASASDSVLKGLLDKAIKAVPAVRYALGVVGVAAAAAPSANRSSQPTSRRSLSSLFRRMSLEILRKEHIR